MATGPQTHRKDRFKGQKPICLRLSFCACHAFKQLCIVSQSGDMLHAAYASKCRPPATGQIRRGFAPGILLSTICKKEILVNAVLPLRLALAANAVFSLSSGLFMLFNPALAGEWLGINAPLILQGIGIGLTAFSAELAYQAMSRRMATWRALIASAADFSWVAGSIVLLLVYANLFSPSGKTLILGVAIVVLCFGAWQLWAAGRAHRITKGGEYRHCIMIETNTPSDKMWKIVSDLGGIKNHMPSLKRSVVLGGKAPGVGAIRVCEDRAGKQWSEECTAFNPGQDFSVRFQSEAPDFPFPAKTMRGGWGVIPSGTGSLVMVWWEMTPKYKLLAPIILPLLSFQVDRDFPKIIQNMAEAATGDDVEGRTRSSVGLFARLVPSYC